LSGPGVFPLISLVEHALASSTIDNLGQSQFLGL
jgi:hypothetical protein